MVNYWSMRSLDGRYWLIDHWADNWYRSIISRLINYRCTSNSWSLQKTGVQQFTRYFFGRSFLPLLGNDKQYKYPEFLLSLTVIILLYLWYTFQVDGLLFLYLLGLANGARWFNGVVKWFGDNNAEVPKLNAKYFNMIYLHLLYWLLITAIPKQTKYQLIIC